MPITWGQAKEILAQYAGRGGKCATDPSVELFTRQVLEYMLYTGAHNNRRKFIFNAIKGCFTAPYELEVPLKVKIDGAVGNAWDKWFEWHPGKSFDGCAQAASDALFEEPDYYPTAYDVPASGANIGVMGTVTEADDAYILVKGFDPTGREVFTKDDGQLIVGERLRIKKGEMRYTQVEFGKITSIVKSTTNGYIALYWIRPAYNLKGFLSDYTPTETLPSYRRFRLTAANCGPCVKVSVLANIRLKPHYSDSDVIPFENLYALTLAGQAQNKNYNDDTQNAQAKDQMLQDILTRENEHKRVQNGQPMEVAQVLSAGNIQNINSPVLTAPYKRFY